jgi:hypothetical protein
MMLVLSAHLKGELIMTPVPLTQCCSLLGIDAKTLRQWRVESSLSLHPHPTDARIKCLTMEQVQHLATLHGRCIKLDAAPLLLEPETPTHLPSECLVISVKTVGTFVSDPDLIGKLAHLEATVATMQQQLTQLTLELLHERERRLQTLEALIQQSGQQACPQEIQAIEADAAKPDAPLTQKRRLHPAEQRARSRVLPLIEYGADGTYVIISPREGELHFPPASPAWFDWLASLSSFRFVGQHGRFTAYRAGSRRHPSRCWIARRFFHNHNHTRYLGITDHLTLDRLEQVAADLHSHIASL